MLSLVPTGTGCTLCRYSRAVGGGRMEKRQGAIEGKQTGCAGTTAMAGWRCCLGGVAVSAAASVQRTWDGDCACVFMRVKTRSSVCLGTCLLRHWLCLPRCVPLNTVHCGEVGVVSCRQWLDCKLYHLCIFVAIIARRGIASCDPQCTTAHA